MKTLKCRFNGYPVQYSFLTILEDVAVGDSVVVDTKNGLQVVTVDEVSEGAERIATRFAFQKVNVGFLQELKEALENAKKHEAERKRIIAKLESKIADQDRFSRYAALAEADPEAKKLVERLQEMSKAVLP